MEHNENRLRVAIAAKQFLCRFGIKTILSVLGLEPEIFETGDFNRLKRFAKKNPGIRFIILSEDVLSCHPHDCLEEIKSCCPGGKLLVMGDEIIEDSRCSHFVLNSDSRKAVLEKFQDFFFEPETVENGHSGNTFLSDREIDVLKVVAQGYSNKEIADKLCISINTVITHRRNITEKLGIKTIAGLTVYALMNNLISPDEVKR